MRPEQTWTQPQIAMLRRLVALNTNYRGMVMNWGSIALDMRRTKTGVCNKWDRLCGKARVQNNVARKNHVAVSNAVATPSEIAQRDYRSTIEPRDLTASLMGDPLPGFSALERRDEAA